ncbi:MAG: hypothetical protein HY819_20080 [Acidobacteria bacterium]|nr:hypothetical protein [Acidobacteriota bacterium]
MTTNDNDAFFLFDLDTGRTANVPSQQLEWANRVFAEPVQTASLLNLSALELPQIDIPTEASLYTQLQNRDSEIGVMLLELRKNDLREALQTIREALIKRERDCSVGRNRLEALEKINASEPNPQLRYPQQTFDDIKAQIATDKKEMAYLQQWNASLSALEHTLKVFDENSNRASRVNEQLVRLIGQGFRGQARLRAFAGHFRDASKKRLPSLKNYSHGKDFSGYLLSVGENISPIAIDARTGAYLRHLLETISLLAELSTEFLRNCTSIPVGHWKPLLSLVRAIVEFFYICNFELPHFYINLAVDAQDPNKIWHFDSADNQWKDGKDDPTSNKYLKRLGVETALLLADNSALLKCRSADELNRFLKIAAPSNSNAPETINLCPYRSCGLAEYDDNNQKLKVTTAFNTIGVLLEQLIKDNPSCLRIASSPLGNTLNTLVGMAELDPQAFGLDSNLAVLKESERFRLLSDFWKIIGRWRAIAMLGDDYAKRVTKGMEAIGQPGPEHPTFLSVVLKPTMVKMAVDEGDELIDPFSALMLADQVRLLEMLNISWTIAEDFLDRLKDVHSLGKLKRIVEGLPQLGATAQGSLQKRFNPKWMQASSWIWSVLRSCAPSLWDFWSKINSEQLWDEYANAPTMQAFTKLLRLFCEIGRLVLLIEASGSGIAERLQFTVDKASQGILSGVQAYLEGSSMPVPLAEVVNYYYDPEIKFDTSIAFVSSFHNYLKQLTIDLKAINATESHVKGVIAILRQLDLLYPPSVIVKETPEPEVLVTPPSISNPELVGAITEKDAELFSRVFFDLLGQTEQDTNCFLKILSMLARKETLDFIYTSDRIQETIKIILPKPEQKVLLLSFPNTTKNFFTYLQSIDSSKGKIDQEQWDTLKNRAGEYFEQLKEFVESLSNLTNHLPRILPLDKEVLNNFIKATAPANRDLPFLMLFACDHLIMDICTNNAERLYQMESALGKLRAYLREQMGAEFQEPSIELFPIGGGRLACRDGRFFLTGHNESFELAFTDPHQSMTNYIISKIASIKFSYAAQVLHTEFPDLRFFTQL